MYSSVYIISNDNSMKYINKDRNYIKQSIFIV